MIVEVIWVAFDSETLEEMVVYIHSDSIKWKLWNTMWVRPKSMFLENVSKNDILTPRFRFIW